MPFFLALEIEIEKATLAGKSIIIEMDANSKVGKDVIPGDPSEKASENGKLFLEILDQHSNLHLVNSTNLCKGLITRSRTANNIEEKSIIDFVIVSDELLPVIKEMIIDEEGKYSLSRIRKEKGKTIVTDSDHHTIISELDISWSDDNKSNQRIEAFNYRNKECQQTFKSLTTNTTKFTDLFENKGDNILLLYNGEFSLSVSFSSFFEPIKSDPVWLFRIRLKTY